VQPTPRTSGRGARLALTAASVLVLLGIVAVASRSGFGHTGGEAPSRTFLNYAFTSFLILFVLAIPVAAYGYVIQARDKRPRERRRFEVRVGLGLLGVVIVFAFLVVRFYLMHRGGSVFHVHIPSAAGAAGARGHGSRRVPYAPRFEWSVVALVGVAVLVAAVTVLERTRRAAVVEPIPTDAVDLAETIGGAIDDLERETDPRRAVIAAYARMESDLARHGLRRRPSEAPLEYLRRVLLGLGAGGAAVERLTELFERARFSQHEIDVSMKRDALTALREIREEFA
jgi:Domain of unknown function (DUF4129)